MGEKFIPEETALKCISDSHAADVSGQILIP
jgi:hypothetical protein